MVKIQDISCAITQKIRESLFGIFRWYFPAYEKNGCKKMASDAVPTLV